MKQSRYHFVLALLVVMLTVVGCGPLNFGINTRAVTITVNLDEGTLNTLLTQVQESVVAVNGEALLGKIDRIDFIEPDTIRVFGTRTQNGSAYVQKARPTAASEARRSCGIWLSIFPMPQVPTSLSRRPLRSMLWRSSAAL